MSIFVNPEGRLGRFTDVFLGIIITGTLVLVCSLPVFTIGASVTAGYYTMIKCVRRSSGYVLKEYFKSFKQNFKQATLMSIGYIVIAGIIVFDYIYLKGSTGENADTLRLILIVVAVLAAANLLFMFMLLSRFDMRGFKFIKFGVLIMFRHLPTALIILLMAGAAAVACYYMPWGLWLFPGLALYGSTFVMERIMKKYMKPAEEGSEEADKWYYK